MADALTEISLNKLPPYNKEAEQSVLVSCLHSSEAIAKALEVLSEEDFYKYMSSKESEIDVYLGDSSVNKKNMKWVDFSYPFLFLKSNFKELLTLACSSENYSITIIFTESRC